MTCYTMKITVIIVAVSAGLVVDALACPGQKAPNSEKHDRQIKRFAIAGEIDINGDGKSDLETIRYLIMLNGGQIDAELSVDGKLTGKLRPETKYIILGECPDKDTVAPKVAKRFDAFLRRASKLGIPVVSLKKLLSNGPTRRAPNYNEPNYKSNFQPRPSGTGPY